MKILVQVRVQLVRGKTTLIVFLSAIIIFGTSSQITLAEISQGRGGFHSLKEISDNIERGDPITFPNPQHVLALRPNSNWVCVYFETASHLNWDMVLYSEPDSPQITTSIFYGNKHHYVTYQTNKEAVGSVKRNSDAGHDSDGYILEISMVPTAQGDLTVTVPSIESGMFEDYCVKFNKIPNSHFFMYLADGHETPHKEMNVNPVFTTVKLHYDPGTELVGMALACRI